MFGTDMGPRSSGPLQEGVEVRTRQDRLGLLQSLDLFVPGSLTHFEILHHKVAALVQLRLVVRELLQLQHHGLLVLLRGNQVGLRLGLLVRLVHNRLALGLDGGVCHLDKVLVRLLRVLLRPDGLGLHGLSDSQGP
eukprot:UN4679